MVGFVECTCIEAFVGRGHPNVVGLHESTFEVVGESRLTPRGDCIVCVSARRVGGDCGECRRRGACFGRGLLVAVTPEGVVRAVWVSGLCGDGAKAVVRAGSNCRDAVMCCTGRPASRLDRELVGLLGSGFTKCVFFTVFLGLDLEGEEAQILGEAKC